MKKIIDLNGVRGSFIKLSSKTEQERNLFLSCLTLELVNNRKKILTANEKDVKNAYKNNLSEVFIQRLKLDSEGFNSIVEKVKQVQSLESGIGEIMEKKTNDSGLILHKVRVPIGTILIVYESRPEVTIDVACLCIKSGNTALLKGGSEALNTNIALYVCIQQALSRSSLPLQSISFIQSKNRTIIKTLLKQNNYIDLVIARGGYKMVKYIQSHSTIPVLAHSSGGARIYIDKSADLSIVEKIIINAKVSKPAACNSLDTIVIHTDIKDKILNTIQKSFEKNNVKIIDDEWDEEFLSMRVSIKIVNSLNEAIRFINAHSKKHSEGIIAQDKTIIRQFCQSIDAAVIFVNSSTRLNDGYIFGLGSEMGIATGKLHARGPVGLKVLSIYKWIIYGQGHIRE